MISYPLDCLHLQLGFLRPFNTMQPKIAKKKISFVLSKDWTHNHPINNLNTWPLNQHIFHDDSHNFKDLSSSKRVQYIITQKHII